MVTISHVEQLIMRKRGVMVRVKERNHRQPRRRYVIRECQRTLLIVEDAFRGDRPLTFGEVSISIAGKVITGYGVGNFEGFDIPVRDHE
jgi:hypothetical protein